MTIDEAKEIIGEIEAIDDGLGQYIIGFDKALNMAITSLEAWGEIKAEIEDMLETLSDGGDDWFTAEKLNDVLEIINKHLQEVADD